MPTHIQATEKVTEIPKPQSTLLTAPSEFLEENISVHSDDFTFWFKDLTILVYFFSFCIWIVFN